MPDGGDPHPRIGAALQQERERQGLSLEDVEQRTKIRTRYLRALENEDWDIIPGPTYVRGFLRTYAEALGLDPEELVDDYREEFEAPQPRGGLGEGVLTEYRGPDRKRRFGRGWLIAVLVVGLIALLLALGLWGGSDDDDGDAGKGAAGAHKGDGKGGESAGAGGGGGKPGEVGEDVPDTVELELAPNAESEICLVNKGGAVLIDNQVLGPGDDEKFEADAFDLSIGFGKVELTINGRGESVEAKSDSPVTYEVTPSGLRQPVPDADPDCP
jgi:cytoskeleton protein RodZ